MPSPRDRLFIYHRARADIPEFIHFWAERYSYAGENLYTDNIAGPQTDLSLSELFRWKVGPRFFDTALPDLKRHFISRQDEARHLPNDVPPEAFLQTFPSGGAIYRVFWLHCWQPDRFPIYDQHVHRAMTFLEEGATEELTRHPNARKIELYLTRYLPFWSRFAGMNGREVDKALWAFGRFIKRPPLPIGL